jgi:DNA-binding NarL/FixJ family response regulator
MATQTKSLLVVDDHPLFRAALKQAARLAAPDYELVEAASLGEAKAKLRDGLEPALITLDLRMSDSDGLIGLLTLKAEAPALPVIVVSADDSQETASRAMACGAAGYITKSAPLNEIVAAIKAVLVGEKWAPNAASLNDPDEASKRLLSLTPAQMRVLMGISDGLLNKQIAYDMGISEATVKAHVTAVFRKLDVFNRTQAVLAAKSILLAQNPAAPA